MVKEYAGRPPQPRIAGPNRRRTNRGAGEAGEPKDNGKGVAGASSAPAQPFISFGFAALLVTLTYWAIDVTSPALPEIKDTFGLSAKGAGLIFSFVFLGRLFGNFPAARLLESIGSPFTAAIGGVLMAAGSTVNAVSPTIEVLYAGTNTAGCRHRLAGQRRLALDSVRQTGAWGGDDLVRHRVDHRRGARTAE